MQKNILSILFVVAMLFVISCEDTRLDNISLPKLYIPQSGEVEQVIFRTGEPFVLRLGVTKTGHDEVQVPATAIVNIKSEAELNVYNLNNNTNYRRLPDDCFHVSVTSLNFSRESRVEFVNITIDYNTVAALPDFDETNSEQYVIPVELVQASIEVNEEKTFSFIKPLIRDPFIYFRGLQSSITIEPTALNADYRQNLILDIDFPNIWNISVDLEVDPSLVAVYNAANGTHFSLLPAETYTISPNPAVIANGRNSVFSTVTIDAVKTDFDEFLLPITIGNTSKFEGEPGRNIHYLAVSKPAPRLSREGWTIHDYSSHQLSDGGGVTMILNSETGSFWHSSWSPPSEPPHHATIDMQKEVLVTHIEIRRRNGNAGTRIGSFHISSDGINFTQIGIFDMPASDAGNPFWLFKVASTRGRYLKIVVDSTHAMISEVHARGTDE
ncbi:MAG: DUF1735 domain-containing protein [Dysgonamonadaceae bacterium]|nr:DUF1735 domain-containing protein [Dysgonamonadaceae bacterium]